MNDYKKHFQKLNQNRQQPPSKRLSLNYSSNRVRSPFPFQRAIGAFTAFGFCLALYGLVYPEAVGEITDRIQIGFLAQGHAESSTASADSAEQGASLKEKSAAAIAAKPTGENAAASPAVGEKPSHIDQLLEKERELVEREKRVLELEEKLQQQKAELDEKLKSLDQARREIASRLETRVAQDEESLEKLVGVYSNMKPLNAAQVISKLDEELAISLLRRMKKQDAGAILNFMDPAKTKALTEKYTGY